MVVFAAFRSCRIEYKVCYLNIMKTKIGVMTFCSLDLKFDQKLWFRYAWLF